MNEGPNIDNSEALEVVVLTKNRLNHLLTIMIPTSFAAFYLWQSQSPYASAAFFLISVVSIATIAINEVKRIFR